MSPSNEYTVLIAQLQSYIVQEYAPQSWLGVSRDSLLYYRQYAMAQGMRKQEIKPVQPAVKNQPFNITQKAPEVKIQEPPIKVQAPLPSPLPVQENVKVKTKKIDIEPSPSTEKQDFSDLRKIMAERFPEQVLLANPPDDSLAKKIKNERKMSPQHAAFITHLCRAMEVVHGVKAEVTGKVLRWENKSCELQDIDQYLQNPKLKAELWNRCNMLL
jgi:hypothetical protein